MSMADFLQANWLQLMSLGASALAAVLTITIRLAIAETRLELNREMGKVTHEIGQLELRMERRVTAVETKLGHLSGRHHGVD